MRSLIFTALLLILTLAGCGSVPSLSERFDPVLPQTRVYRVDRATVFDAAQRAMKQIDFKVTKNGLAQGMVDGISRVQTGNSFQGARQFSMEVRLSEPSAGHVAVSILLREQEESASFAGATDMPVRENGLYGAYFSALEQELGQKPDASGQ